jgi:hypothetical protein
MSTKHAKHGMSYAWAFRDLPAEAAGRAAADIENPNLGKHRDRDGMPLTYTPRAAEAVILSVTALEAGINEIIAWVQRMSMATMPAEYNNERTKLTEKWTILPRALVGKELDRGTRPWQDFKAVVGLRDQLVHFKPDGAEVPAFMRTLQARDLAIPDEPSIYWVDAALTDRVAGWASETCEQMFAALARHIGRTDPLDWRGSSGPAQAQAYHRRGRARARHDAGTLQRWGICRDTVTCSCRSASCGGGGREVAVAVHPRAPRSVSRQCWGLPARYEQRYPRS